MDHQTVIIDHVLVLFHHQLHLHRGESLLSLNQTDLATAKREREAPTLKSLFRTIYFVDEGVPAIDTKATLIFEN